MKFMLLQPSKYFNSSAQFPLSSSSGENCQWKHQTGMPWAVVTLLFYESLSICSLFKEKNFTGVKPEFLLYPKIGEFKYFPKQSTAVVHMFVFSLPVHHNSSVPWPLLLLLEILKFDENKTRASPTPARHVTVR